MSAEDADIVDVEQVATELKEQSELARVKTHNSNSNVNKQTLLSGTPRGHSFTEGKKNRRIEGCKYGLGRDLRQA